MATLVLVRHGQASFLSDDYDRLSPLGELQARLLGAAWARSGLVPTRVIVGPRRRQRDTATLAGQSCVAAGCSWPAAEHVDAFDEHHVQELLTELLPDIAAEHVEIAEGAAAVANADSRRARARATELLLQQVMRLWAADELRSVDGRIERWREFEERVEGAMRDAMARAEGGARIAVFSSGGAIGVAVGRLLAADAERCLELGWSVQNSSVSEVRFSGDRVSLSRFNCVGHLDDPAHWTYR